MNRAIVALLFAAVTAVLLLSCAPAARQTAAAPAATRPAPTSTPSVTTKSLEERVGDLIRQWDSGMDKGQFVNFADVKRQLLALGPAAIPIYARYVEGPPEHFNPRNLNLLLAFKGRQVEQVLLRWLRQRQQTPLATRLAPEYLPPDNSPSVYDATKEYGCVQWIYRTCDIIDAASNFPQNPDIAHELVAWLAEDWPDQPRPTSMASPPYAPTYQLRAALCKAAVSLADPQVDKLLERIANNENDKAAPTARGALAKRREDRATASAVPSPVR